MQARTWILAATLVLIGCPSDSDSSGDDDAGDDDAADDDAGDDDIGPVDEDQDGYEYDVDCDDTDPETHPGAVEICDGTDNDCDGFLPSDEADADGDGQMACEGDCDDSDPNTGMGFFESCDGVDTNCDGSVEGEVVDADGDGQTPCEGDCDDADATVYFAAPDVSCDGVDSNCHGEVEYLVPADFSHIQDAINAIVAEGEVCVSPGTYVENLDFLGKTVCVIGIEGAENTIIDGGQAGPVVRMDSGEPSWSKLEGLTLTNGHSSDGGGGIYLEHTSPTLIDVSLAENSATYGGGDVSVWPLLSYPDQCLIRGERGNLRRGDVPG